MAKDSRWSWFVSLGAFATMFIENSMVKSLGVLLPDLREQFTTYTWVIGLAISLAPGFGAVTCIAATGLKKVSSSRVILMLFGALSSAGLLISAMASSVDLFTAGLVLTGFSFGAEATYLAILPVYFDKYFDISNGVAHAGLSMGLMVMPLFTQYILDAYGWRGAMLILCALNTNLVVSGALVIPVSQHILHTPQETPHKQSQLFETITRTFDLKVFKNFELASLLSVYFGVGVYYTGWLIYFVPHAQSLGFSLYAASTLATVGGVGNLLGNCAFPLLAKVISSNTLVILCQLGAFLSLAMDPVLSVGPFYYGIMSASFALNFFYSVLFCAWNKEALLILTEDDYFGFLNWGWVCYGAGSILSGFLAGWLFDKYDHYTFSFIFLSSVPFVTLLPMIIQSFCNRTKLTYTPISKDDQDAG